MRGEGLRVRHSAPTEPPKASSLRHPIPLWRESRSVALHSVKRIDNRNHTGIERTHRCLSDAHPHRFRDTFAVDMLARGASPYDVEKLLGDTIETVEKHYAEFVRELRERVRRMMESNERGLEAFSKPAKRPSSSEVLARMAVNRA
jgi:integrase